MVIWDSNCWYTLSSKVIIDILNRLDDTSAGPGVPLVESSLRLPFPMENLREVYRFTRDFSGFSKYFPKEFVVISIFYGFS